jgi:phenylalanyl-tRNA synthetase alpha chain
MINELKNEIEQAKNWFLKEVGEVRSQEDFRIIKEKYTSRKKGILTGFLQRLKDVPQPDKPSAGNAVNQLKVLVENGLNEAEIRLTSQQAAKETYADPTLPPFVYPVGRAHLLSAIRKRAEDIFISMGYEVAHGYEVELDEYNFTTLNFPEYHPSRDEQDTFFIKDFPDHLLRTHTSPVQIRYMKQNIPPLKIISPGKVFRKDDPDATHSPVFNQVEGLLVDKNIHFSHLKGTLELFIKAFYGENINARLRPSYFPFTEPSAELDISCFMCFGKNPLCRVCKGTGWIEILGCGMVHPKVLLNCNIDPEVYSGFAFGMGIERIAMLKYEVSDMRMMYDNDLRFNCQFG